MNMLIIVGLLGFGLLALIVAIFLAINEEKDTSVNPEASSILVSSTKIPAETVKLATTPEPRLPAIREDAPVTILSTQFSELTAQLHALHEQAREIERRLNILSSLADHIEHNQSSVTIEETDDYRLPESISSARA